MKRCNFYSKCVVDWKEAEKQEFNFAAYRRCGCNCNGVILARVKCDKVTPGEGVLHAAFN